MKNTEERKLWAVRPEDGRRFLDEHMIALGGADMGDLSLLPDSKEAYREQYETARPKEAAAARASGANLYYRLIHELHSGDYAAMLWNGEACLGVIEGEYSWNPGAEGSEHRRAVRWDKRIPQDDLPRAALREINASPVALFAVPGDGGQFLSAFDLPPLKTTPKAGRTALADSGTGALEGGSAAEQGTAVRAAGTNAAAGGGSAPGPDGGARERRIVWSARPADPEPVAPLPDHLAAKALADPRAFLVDEWRRHMDANDLREFTAGLLKAMDYEVEVPDNELGVDLVACRDELTPRLLVLVRYGTVTEADVAKLEASLPPGENGTLVTLSDLSPEVEARLKDSPWLRCVDGTDLASLVLKYYGTLDEKFQRKIPLRMGYVPAT